MSSRLRLIISLCVLIFILLTGGCRPVLDFDSRLNAIVKPYLFSLVKWEFETLPETLDTWFSDSSDGIEDEVSIVNKYFLLIHTIKNIEQEIEAIKVGNSTADISVLETELMRLEQQRVSMDEVVVEIMASQIVSIFAEQDIYNPVSDSKAHFPPLLFTLTTPPHLLVISPRDRIDTIREITLQPGITIEEMESIEDESDILGVSSLVAGLGGIAAYPSIVTNDADLRFVIDTVAEEWLHQYLTFTPLGFRYALDVIGISRNYEIATINETVVGIVSREIGGIVEDKYYNGHEASEIENRVSKSGFDFNKEMRGIRKAVDQYLAAGEIERAEEYMEQKRQYLVSKGYYIRKLNQAYFAFHGAYADRPTSISPIGAELKELRRRSASIKEFLDTAATIKSRQDLQIILSDRGVE